MGAGPRVDWKRAVKRAAAAAVVVVAVVVVAAAVAAVVAAVVVAAVVVAAVVVAAVAVHVARENPPEHYLDFQSFRFRWHLDAAGLDELFWRWVREIGRQKYFVPVRSLQSFCSYPTCHLALHH